MIHGFNVKFEDGLAHLTVSATFPIPQERQSIDEVRSSHNLKAIVERYMTSYR